MVGFKRTSGGVGYGGLRRVQKYERPGISVKELQTYVGERDRIKQVYNDNWTKPGLDALVVPGFGRDLYRIPAGSVPHGCVDPAVDVKNTGPYANRLGREIVEMFDPEVFRGAPTESACSFIQIIHIINSHRFFPFLNSSLPIPFHPLISLALSVSLRTPFPSSQIRACFSQHTGCPLSLPILYIAIADLTSCSAR